jgi:hypothetical protein
VLAAFHNTALQLHGDGLLLPDEEPPVAHSEFDYVVDGLMFADYLTR